VGILARLRNYKTWEFTQTLKNQYCGIEQFVELSSLRNFYPNSKYLENGKLKKELQNGKNK
jgi:hypothetical protein